MKRLYQNVTKQQWYKLICFLMISVIFGDCSSQEPSKNDYILQRKRMVDRQIKARGIKDKKVIDAMLKVERHMFVLPEYTKMAYADHPLPIGEGQTISQPYIVAIMTEVLKLDKTSSVLEIGTGSGYQAAVLAEICDSVYTIEVFKSLSDRAKVLLSALGYKNVNVKTGDGYKGWPGDHQFDVIIVTCSPTHIPQPLKDQLAEGGRMVIPVGEKYSQELVLLEKRKGKIHQKEIISVRFVPMINEKGESY